MAHTVWGVVGGLLLVVAGLFSALETAYSLWDAELQKRLRERAPHAAKRLEKMAHGEVGGAGGALAIGDALLNFLVLAMGVLALPVAGEIFDVPGWVLAGLGFGVVVVWVEVLPKLAALRWTAEFLEWGVPVIEIAHAAFGPSAKRLDGVLRWWGLRGREAERRRGSGEEGTAELAALVVLAAEDGAVSWPEAGVLRGVLGLGGRTAAHCMTPRVSCVMVADDWGGDEVRSWVRRSRHERLPVYGENPDEILGVLPACAALLCERENFLELLEPPSFVRADFLALDLLRNFLVGRQRMALLLDEYGGFEGLVTLEDLLDEVFGEAPAEAKSGLYIEEVGAGEWLLSGQVRLDDLAGRVVGADFEAKEADTVAGLLMERLSRVPRKGERVRLGGWEVVVRRVSGNQIREVLLRRLMDGDGAGEGR